MGQIVGDRPHKEMDFLFSSKPTLSDLNVFKKKNTFSSPFHRNRMSSNNERFSILTVFHLAHLNAAANISPALGFATRVPVAELGPEKGSEFPSHLLGRPHPQGGDAGSATPRPRSGPVAGRVRAQGPSTPHAGGEVAEGTWVPGCKAGQPPTVSSLSDGSAAGRVGFHDSKLAKRRRQLACARADVTTRRLQSRLMLWE